MSDYKHAYDVLMAQQAEVQAIAARIEERFAEEDIAGALALEPELDEAVEMTERLSALYNKMRSPVDSISSKFVPAAESATDSQDGGKVIGRAAFDAMSAVERGKYLAAGGQVSDEVQK